MYQYYFNVLQMIMHMIWSIHKCFNLWASWFKRIIGLKLNLIFINKVYVWPKHFFSVAVPDGDKYMNILKDYAMANDITLKFDSISTKLENHPGFASSVNINGKTFGSGGVKLCLHLFFTKQCTCNWIYIKHMDNSL